MCSIILIIPLFDHTTFVVIFPFTTREAVVNNTNVYFIVDDNIIDAIYCFVVDLDWKFVSKEIVFFLEITRSTRAGWRG